MRKNIKFVLLALVWVASALNNATAQDAKAKTILDAMRTKYKAIAAFQANFLCTMSSPSTGVNENYKGEITVKGAKFYLKLPKQEVLTDGVTQWSYTRDANEVTINNYAPDPDDITPNKIYELYESNYEYSYIEKIAEQGKNYHIIELKPKNRNAQFFKVRLKITEKNGLKSWELFERNSNRYLYTIQKFAEVSVSDAFFQYNKANFPAGHTVEDMR
ncbi:MAG: outer membrane lipoprotein carrier protein LolA [Bacteroidetes bacterium]|nr:MAG: outer membrane lipoprotein carrier protein LolA [Bacteroidota bacterium]